MANVMALQSCAMASSLAAPSSFQRLHTVSVSSSSSTGPHKVPLNAGKFVILSQYRENGLNYFLFSKSPTSVPVLKAARDSFDWMDDSSASNGTEMKEDAMVPITWEANSEKQLEGIVPSERTSLLTLSKDMAMGLVLQAATATGWTTGSGLEGPAVSKEESVAEEEKSKFPYLSKSPRRKMRVAFTCNVCGERTTRAINPHAYSDGTVFVQCKGCDVFHKLVDNLNLFHEMNGKIYRGYDTPWYANDQPYDFFNGQYPIDDHFPRL
ncbi:hypothetical protein Mapa_013142 [Marchantia paleacea]|nr:hypothetical protein Mapa_013142 [Marchantia paleacea]